MFCDLNSISTRQFACCTPDMISKTTKKTRAGQSELSNQEGSEMDVQPQGET